VLTTPEGEGFKTRRVPGAPVDYRNFYANLRDALLGTAQVEVSTQAALNVMQVLELARQSSAKRCTVPYMRVSASGDHSSTAAASSEGRGEGRSAKGIL
jgi:hypothetical protein